jgi:hypothetical protein
MVLSSLLRPDPGGGVVVLGFARECIEPSITPKVMSSS